MTGGDLAEACAPLVVELAALVRTGDREAITELLARVPEGRTDVALIVAAAMLDPTADPAVLLAWTESNCPEVVAERRRLLAAGVRTEWVVRLLSVEAGRRTDPALVGLDVDQRHQVHLRRERDRDRHRRYRNARRRRDLAHAAAATRRRLRSVPAPEARTA